MTFMNHGCHGTYNVDSQKADGTTEQNYEKATTMSPATKLYNPFFDRRRRSSESSFDYALRDIKAGEEVLCNYLYFTEDADDCAEEAEKLRRICNGDEIGDITNFEKENQRAQWSYRFLIVI